MNIHIHIRTHTHTGVSAHTYTIYVHTHTQVCQVNGAESWFTFMLIEYTQKHIVVPDKAIGDKVNLEVDVVRSLFLSLSLSLSLSRSLSLALSLSRARSLSLARALSISPSPSTLHQVRNYVGRSLGNTFSSLFLSSR